VENNTINQQAFGKKLKDARERCHYTQAELAEMTDLSKNFIGDIERGQKLPSLKNLISLSNILKVSLDSLFTDSLDNILEEDSEIYYTERQLSILKNVVKTIHDNF